ncbi:MAG: mechanosensitive ion channel family protein [Candidatus Methylacidiphilales bacterium]
MEIFQTQILNISGVAITAGSLFAGALLSCGVLLFSILLRRWLLAHLFNRIQIDAGNRFAILALTRYFFWGIALLVGLTGMGFNLSSLAVILGALSVGIGFGLQNIFQNFVSGLILLFEQPIRAGDYVDLGDLSGKIERISIRSTTVLTNDNISVIVPNSELVTGRVVNWSHGSPEVRMRIPIGVSYGSDVEKVKQVLLEVARRTPDVLEYPAPAVYFRSFGDSSLNFELGIWRNTVGIRPLTMISNINFGILAAFREHGINIPFPQRDVHLKGGLPTSEKDHSEQ